MDVDYLESGKWMQREKSFTVLLPPKGIIQMYQRKVPQKEVFLTIIYQRQNMDSAAHVAVLRHTLAHKVWDHLCEKPLVLCITPACEMQPELT